jgi:hypothetical protein
VEDALGFETDVRSTNPLAEQLPAVAGPARTAHLDVRMLELY